MRRVPGNCPLYLDCDAVNGTITLYKFDFGEDKSLEPIAVFSALQSELLRSLLETAEHIVETGVGSLDG